MFNDLQIWSFFKYIDLNNYSGGMNIE